MSFPHHSPKRALVTGASQGIGLAVALKLAAEGFEVALVARSEPALQEAVDQIHQAGGSAQAFAIDLADPNRVPGQLVTLLQTFGSCSLLINNAGMGYTSTIADTPAADWRRVLDLNLTAAFLAIQAVLPGMRQQQEGLIINVVSIAGKQVFPTWGAYSASKFGLMALTQAVAQEERQHGIRASAFCPGAVNTSLWDTPTVQADFDRSLMLTVDEVADALLQLVRMPSSTVVDEMVLMPAAGAL